MSVTFAMLASYGLSRTLVPLMSKRLLGHESHVATAALPVKKRTGLMAIFTSIHLLIDSQFENAREHYKGALQWVLETPKTAVALFLGLYALSFCLLQMIG